jgi:tetratricopeptide (TPR) repeat protein
MNKKTIVILLAGGAAIAAATGGIVYLVKEARLRDESRAELEEAKRLLEDARSMGDWSRARNMLSSVQSHATVAARLNPANAVEAAVVEGEALLRMTKYRDALAVLDGALAARPEDLQVVSLSAETAFYLYNSGRRQVDYDRAFLLLDRAVTLGAGTDIVLKAAKLTNLGGQYDRADQYISKIEAAAPDSVEAAEARGLKLQRGTPVER